MIDPEETLKAQLPQIVKQFRWIALIAGIYLTIGTIFYHIVEDLKWLDSIYFCVVSLLTVGYGDITPHTDLGKFFTIFYLLFGVGILATFASIFFKRTMVGGQVYREKRKPEEVIADKEVDTGL